MPTAIDFQLTLILLPASADLLDALLVALAISSLAFFAASPTSLILSFISSDVFLATSSVSPDRSCATCPKFFNELPNPDTPERNLSIVAC